MVAVGVDGCSKGWIAAALDDGKIVSVEYLPTIDELSARFPGATTVGIDIPMGFPTTAEPRKSELEAKKILKGLHNSVFLTPPRAVLEMPTHAEATKLAVELTGKGISRQSFALKAKIFEVQAWLDGKPGRVYEVHPEVSFAALTGVPITPSKKTWGGMAKRRDALMAAGLEVRNISDDAARFAAADDVVDAVVAAWSASRIERGVALSLPDPADLGAPNDVPIWA